MKHKDVYGVALIPAKTDSTRLSQKNLQVIAGKTLVEHSIEYALNSEYIQHIIVSTESQEVKDICKKLGVFLVFDRPEHLMGEAEVTDVYLDIFNNQLSRKYENNIRKVSTHVIAIQPDNPDRNHSADKLIDYFIDKGYDDLVTVDKDGTRNGGIRIMQAEYVRKSAISKKIGTYMDECTNIHTEEDLTKAEQNIKRINNDKNNS